MSRLSNFFSGAVIDLSSLIATLGMYGHVIDQQYGHLIDQQYGHVIDQQYGHVIDQQYGHVILRFVILITIK